MTVGAVGAGMALSLPPIGLGTANDNPERCAATVAAFEMGNRHIDTAQTYGNEAERRLVDPEDAPW